MPVQTRREDGLLRADSVMAVPPAISRGYGTARGRRRFRQSLP